MSRQLKLKAIDAATVTTTSDPIALHGVKRCTLQFIRADHTSGNTVYSVQVSIDGINYVTYNKLIDNVANSNVQTLTRVASATLSSNTSKMYSMDLENDVYEFMKVTATRTTDGTSSVIAGVQLAE